MSFLLDAAKQLLVTGPFLHKSGICDNIALIIHHDPRHATRKDALDTELAAHQAMRRIWPTWPKYSGNIFFPIVVFEPETDYELYTNKWDSTVEYGKLRWELLRHLVTELEKQQ